MQPCLKVNTYCEIILADGTLIRGMNTCNVDGLDVCPRVTAGCKTGEGYELCNPQSHAEMTALAQLDPLIQYPGAIAMIWHQDNWSCGDCQRALVARGIRTHVIGDWNTHPTWELDK